MLVTWGFFILAFGVIFIFLVPPFQKADESTHFLRAAALHQGFFYCESKEGSNQFLVPEKYFLFIEHLDRDRIAAHYDEKFQPNKLKQVSESFRDRNNLSEWKGFCSLPFFAYILFCGSIILGEITGSLLVSFYLSRILAFIFFLGCVIYSYSVIKDSKLRLVVLSYSLLPMVVHQASSIGYDYLQLAIAPILFSLIVRMHTQDKVKMKSIVAFLIFMIIFLIAKPGYYFISFIFFLVPYKKISSSIPKYLVITFFYLSLCFLLGILVTLFYRNVGLFSGGNGINPLSQLKTLINYKFTFHLIRNTFNDYWDSYIRGFWGRFGWLDYGFSAYIYPLLSVSSMMTIYYTQKDKFFNDYIRIAIVSLITIVTTIGFIFLTTYLSWNQVGSSHIDGIQGRYFLVLVPTMCLFLGSIVRGFMTNKKFRYIFLWIILSLILIELILVVSNRYYDAFPLFFN